MKQHGLYKYVCNNQIIYIGKSNANIRSRIDNHKREPKFQPYLKNAKIYVCDLPNSTETDILEKVLINHYKPILNGTDNKPGISNCISFIEPDWKLYSADKQKSIRKEMLNSRISKHDANEWLVKNQLFLDTYSSLAKKWEDGEYSHCISSISGENAISIDVTDLWLNDKFQISAMIDTSYSGHIALQGHIELFESEHGAQKAFYVNSTPNFIVDTTDLDEVRATIDKYALIC